MLEEIVITASRTQQRIFDSPASLSVIDREALEQSTAYSLGEVLRDIPCLQVTDSGQAGAQRFASTGGRAFCVYAVLGNYAMRNVLVPELNRALGTVTIQAKGPSG